MTVLEKAFANVIVVKSDLLSEHESSVPGELARREVMSQTAEKTTQTQQESSWPCTSVSRGCVHPTSNKGSTFLLVHHPEVMEKKNDQDEGEASLFGNSSLGVSSIFFGTSVP